MTVVYFYEQNECGAKEYDSGNKNNVFVAKRHGEDNISDTYAGPVAAKPNRECLAGYNNAANRHEMHTWRLWQTENPTSKQASQANK